MIYAIHYVQPEALRLEGDAYAVIEGRWCQIARAEVHGLPYGQYMWVPLSELCKAMFGEAPEGLDFQSGPIMPYNPWNSGQRS